MGNHASLDPNSKRISLCYTPEFPEIASGVDLTFSLPDSHRIHHHTIPADKTAGGVAVDLYSDLSSDVDFIDTVSSCK